jgi:hypothetical protein
MRTVEKWLREEAGGVQAARGKRQGLSVVCESVSVGGWLEGVGVGFPGSP